MLSLVMRTDQFGNQIFSEEDLCDIFYSNPTIKLKKVFTDEQIVFDEALELTSIPELIKYETINLTKEQFDIKNQITWLIPEQYKSLDIAKIVLDKCKTDEEIQRAGQELLLFHERNMFELLKYLKFLVDTMREHNIVWGVGRGSSVSSFVLFLLGVHRINSLYYDLSIDEFLK